MRFNDAHIFYLLFRYAKIGKIGGGARLRALETKHFRPLGGAKDKMADVRIIAVTNEDLPAAIAEKRFRADIG